jgi:hypothetical protein
MVDDLMKKGNVDSNEMDKILQRHNNDEMALEDYVKQKLAQPQNFVEINQMKGNLNYIRDKMKT